MLMMADLPLKGWINSDFCRWGEAAHPHGVWEMAKVFLGKLGERAYALEHKRDETDLSADVLIQLMQACRLDAFGARVDPSVLAKAYQTRCTDYGHVVEKHLSEEAAIDTLVAVLEMPRLLDGLGLPASARADGTEQIQ